MGKDSLIWAPSTHNFHKPAHIVILAASYITLLYYWQVDNSSRDVIKISVFIPPLMWLKILI